MDNLNPLAETIKTFIADRLTTKLDAFDKDAVKQRANAEPGAAIELEQKLQEKRAELVAYFQPQNWLTEAAKRAGQISMVTHAPKYTHSDTRGMGVFLQPNEGATEIKTSAYLHSQSLDELEPDVVGNAAALDVARLLQQSSDEHSLLAEIAAGESPALEQLAADNQQYQFWLHGLKAALHDKELKSGQLSKQLYFPVEDGYHLISPLYASSLNQKLYIKITDSFYSESSKSIREARKKGRYCADDAVRFPNIAVQSFGGTKPQNISQLNTGRYGRGFLLSSQPPAWNTQINTPSGSKHSFWRQYDRRAWRTVKSLRDYLERIAMRTSTVERRDRRAAMVDELVDILLICAAEVQQLHAQRGWSAETDLSFAEQLWLDPYRTELDEEFKQQRAKNDWQSDIARQFATWLNSRLSYKTTLSSFSDAEFQEWNRLLEKKLLLLKADLEAGR